MTDVQQEEENIETEQQEEVEQIATEEPPQVAAEEKTLAKKTTKAKSGKTAKKTSPKPKESEPTPVVKTIVKKKKKQAVVPERKRHGKSVKNERRPYVNSTVVADLLQVCFCSSKILYFFFLFTGNHQACSEKTSASWRNQENKEGDLY